MEELPDILNGITKPDLFEKFKLQLQKDFDNCSINSGFVNTLVADFDSILNSLGYEIEKLNKISPSKLTGLMYRIDINEAQIKKMVNQKPDVEFNGIVAELIIKRELQKIIIKEHFKSK